LKGLTQEGPLQKPILFTGLKRKRCCERRTQFSNARFHHYFRTSL
jgi:hypothetical protein